MASSTKTFTTDEVAKHNKEGDLWIVIDGRVFDLSRFAKLHPGGLSVLLDKNIAGQDSTSIFFSLHRHEVLLKPAYARLQIGTIEGVKPQIAPPAPGDISLVPYAEPTWLSPGFSSPYYNDNHRRFHTAVRKFFDEVVAPDALACEENGKKPAQSVIDQLGQKNIIAMRLGPGKHLKGLTLMDGLVTPEQYDYFHEIIITQELGRTGQRGYFDGMLAGNTIGIPPVVNFGSPELVKRVVPEVFAGKKFICLAITEAFAGSDVSGLKTTASKTPDGKHWIVSGTKKWITNGTFADYFTTGCRTETGFTVILIERGPGVETTPIKTSYSSTAGTAFVTFDNVKVPVENTLGKEGAGMNVILSNFNHERFMICAIAARAQRLVVEECLKWAQQRTVFGKPLMAQPVIRYKLAGMISKVEAIQAWLENIAYQMSNMTYAQQSDKLAGPIGLLKMYLTRVGESIAQDATQIFGGRALTKTGMGRVIENFHRTSPFDTILGGAEDVLGDLGVRQAMKKMPKTARL